VLALVVSACALVLYPAGTAQAGIPASLKAGCQVMTPAPGYSYKLCDDGFPAAGGRTKNENGTNAVEVPARYQATAGDDWTGLPPSANDASMPGADTDGNVALDVDISVPTMPAPAGGYPLLIIPHGCCSAAKLTHATVEDQNEFWHYSSAWFAMRGYVVITYTARGFFSDFPTGPLGSTGEMQFDSRRFEINDLQFLAGLVADDQFFDVDPQKVVVTGGSYGGGATWLAATDPIWKSPSGTDMKLVAVAPRYGWTDLVYSLVPNGKHSMKPNELPAFDGSDSLTPMGIPKKSIFNFLYDEGNNGLPPYSTIHSAFPPYIDDLASCLNSTDPFETNPVCTQAISTTLPSFINDRSAYYQNSWFTKITSDPAYRVPIFNAGTLTDPLFTAVENLRMSNRILGLVPAYPIQQYFGDIEHFAQDKYREWGDNCGSDSHLCTQSDYPGGDFNATPPTLVRPGINTRLNRFLDHYAQPPGNPSEPLPAFDVALSLMQCSAGGNAGPPGPLLTGPSFSSLAQGTVNLDMTGTQTTVNDATPNAHATSEDPVNNSNANQNKCAQETTPAGAGVATYESTPLTGRVTMLPPASVSIDYSATSTAGNFQLDSRLYDVGPDGTALLVDRGVRRVTAGSGTATYQLHGQAYRFEGGHRIRIEIAQDDDPFLKASNVSSSATITHVGLSIPTRERTMGYPRPQAGANFRVPLTIAYKPCTTLSNREHAPPLNSPSCNPAVQESNYLTVGTPDSNGKMSRSVGVVKLVALPGDSGNAIDDADVSVTQSMTDVRKASDLTDYAGELQTVLDLRITDKFNGASQLESGTVVDLPVAFAVPCSATSDPNAGSTCALTSTLDALVPGSVPEGRRSNWEIGQVEVFDGGADGSASTAGNTLFAREGIFIP
jgi:dienelactone hydrolase